MDTTTIIWGTLFGGIGMGYMVYGKKQKNLVALASGIALTGFPYVVTNPVAIIATGALLMAVPWFVKV